MGEEKAVKEGDSEEKEVNKGKPEERGKMGGKGRKEKEKGKGEVLSVGLVGDGGTNRIGALEEKGCRLWKRDKRRRIKWRLGLFGTVLW